MITFNLQYKVLAVFSVLYIFQPITRDSLYCSLLYPCNTRSVPPH